MCSLLNLTMKSTVTRISTIFDIYRILLPVISAEHHIVHGYFGDNTCCTSVGSV